MWKKVLLTIIVLVIILTYQANQKVEEFKESEQEKVEQVDSFNVVINFEDTIAVVDMDTVEVLYHYTASDLLPETNKGVKVNHHSYTLSYVEDYEQSEWVAHLLTPDYITGSAKRKSSFKYDKGVLTKSATHKDYTHSGYDRGHLLPAADRKSSQEDMNETFYMSNVAPQNSCLNREGWRLLEERIREKVLESDSLFIVTGTVVTNDSLRIGKNKVVVPQYFYKIVLDYDPSSYCASAYLVPNFCISIIDERYLVSIDSLETLSGIDFFAQLPDDFEIMFESKKGCLKF